MSTEAGVKFDGEKPRLSLVLFGFANALQAVGEVGTFGANKYTDNGWLSVPNGKQRYTDAMLRHLLAQATGESHDTESHLLHAAHAAWNALARLELEIRCQQIGMDGRLDVSKRLQQQVDIRGTASPFGALAADALGEIEQLRGVTE